MLSYRLIGLAAIVVCVCAIQLVPAQTLDTTWLSSLDLTQMHQGWGTPQKNLSVSKHPLSIGSRIFTHGVGTHARSTLWMNLAGEGGRYALLR
jgi:hypothetical protein